MKIAIALLRQIPLALFSLFIVGCSSVDLMTSEISPQFTGQSFDKILVEAHLPNLLSRKYAEDSFCAQIIQRTTSGCMRSYRLFFPGESHPPKKVSKAVEKHGIDGVLQIRANALTSGDPRSGYDISLLSAQTDETVWVASSVAEYDPEEFNFDEFSEDAADAAIGQLIKDGILRPHSD